MCDIAYYEKQGMALRSFYGLMIDEWCKASAAILRSEMVIEEIKSKDFFKNRNLQMSQFYRNWANSLLKEVQA